LKPHDQLKALADPTRLRIAVLLSTGELCVCDLTEVLKLPQPTISRHMAKLKSAGIVVDRRAGKWIHYKLSGDHFVVEVTGPVAKNLIATEPFVSDRALLVSYLTRKKCD
jgi:ArsR family transcriptional regulator